MNKSDSNVLKPSKIELDNLLKLYQDQKFIEAENLCLSIIKKYPNYQFTWKILSAVLKNNGKINDSLVACRKSIELRPEDSEAHFNYGYILKQLGKLEEAKLSYEKAIELKPNNSQAYSNLGNIFKELGNYKDAENNYKKALSVNPTYAETHYNLGVILKELGRIKESEMYIKKSLEIKPNYLEAEHLYSALKGLTTNSAPRAYVENLFDKFAINFEESLVEKLEYRIPKKIAEIIIPKNQDISLGSILDLGCGTGLIGNELKDNCSKIDGIDLSKSMLQKAKTKNIYNNLKHTDIIEFLSTKNLEYDYFIAADVFVYIGDLSEIFKLIKFRNKFKGKFIFSTQHIDEGEFILEKSGKYSHSKKYIEKLCKQYSYNIFHFEKTDLRKESGKFVIGGLYFLDF